MNGQQLIERERQRQKDVEGYTTQHDDEHNTGELESAGKCYEDNAHKRLTEKLSAPAEWPWGSFWWKPTTDEKRDMEKAGALYLAEAERFNRMMIPMPAHLRDAISRCAARIDALLEQGK